MAFDTLEAGGNAMPCHATPGYKHILLTTYLRLEEEEEGGEKQGKEVEKGE